MIFLNDGRNGLQIQTRSGYSRGCVKRTLERHENSGSGRQGNRGRRGQLGLFSGALLLFASALGRAAWKNI